MASAWQSMEEAALTLGVSSRTLHRRMTRGEVQTRLNNGRREVWVELPDQPAAAPEAEAVVSAQPVETVTLESDSGSRGQLSAETQQTMLALSEDRVRRTDLAIMAYQQSVNVVAADARRTRTSARIAWSLTGTMVAGLFLCVTWATNRLSTAEAEVRHLQSTVQSLSVNIDKTEKDADKLRMDVTNTKLAAARTEGELSATRAELASAKVRREAQEKPSTRPALLQRLGEMMVGTGGGSGQ